MSMQQNINDIKRKADGRKIVFVSGNFNIVHPGHLRLLRFAKECGEFLVVGVNRDGLQAGGMLPEKERLAGIEVNIWVDYSFILQEKAEVFIEKLQPAVVVKGKEHEKMFNPEKDIIKSYGGKLVFSSGEVTFSSLDLLSEEYRMINHSSIKKPDAYMLRHGISLVSLQDWLNCYKKLNIAVLGDSIVDEYITCEPLGMSREEPAIVVTPLNSERFAGGAAIVAAHSATLGAHVDFFSVTGKDDAAEFLEEKLSEYRVHSHLFYDDSRPTTLKQRFRAADRSLLRVSHLRQHDIQPAIQEQIIAKFEEIAPTLGLVIFSDFNYGCLPQNLVDKISNICCANGVPIVADSQSSSQSGDVSRFKGSILLTPTEHEARLAVRDTRSGLVILAEKLRDAADGKNVLLTLGAEGLLVHANEKKNENWETDRLPALNSYPKDSAGAGDSLLAVTSMSLALGANIWEAALLGALAAACQVGRLGNIPLEANELRVELENFINRERKY